ncbi:MAG TPA: cation:proton antiporter [Actinomycetota bacterium]|jgi:Kef-type K+ transport system membrane component KefB|nr:cation:proton antiporter [Actinomycetota bacterium]
MQTLGGLELARMILAIFLLLVVAHAAGYLANRSRQPRVIGEILGGLLLGPTLLGAVAPDLHDRIFPPTGPVPIVLDALYQLGLLLLMFSAGSEIRSSFRADERRTVGAVTLTGMLVPFLAGLGFVAALPEGAHIGPAGDRSAFVLVFALAIAVTSIPVISRIMFDLGILETAFARIVLTVAVLEDVVIYVLLAIALGLVAGSSGDVVGVPSMLGLEPGSVVSIGFHVAATIGFLALALWLGPRVYRAILHFRFNVVKRGSPIAFQIVFMLAGTALAVGLDVAPLFGAFVAGIVVGSAEGTAGAEAARQTIRDFSFAFFIPLYFAIVGLRLDLIHGFEPLFFVLFLVVACVVKYTSVWAAARWAGESPHGARNLGVALNARGGPGIVLASVAFDAGIVDSGFYAVLVMLAIVTSLIAGSWLGRVVRSGAPLR